MFNYCPAKPLTKAEPVRLAGWEINDGSVTFGSGTQMLKNNKRCSQRVLLVNLSHSIARIHSDHHDLGGVCAACCHDSHPGGQSILIQRVSLTQSRDIKNIKKSLAEQLYLFGSLYLVSKGPQQQQLLREGRGYVRVRVK